MKVYISHNYRNLTSAGNKAKSDVEDILADEGFVNIGLKRSYRSGKVAAYFLNLAGILKASAKLRKGDVLFLQYPLKKYFTFICKVAHSRGAKVVALVHDLGSERRKALTVKQELKRLGNADHVIATNAVMAEHLERIGLDAQISALGLCDYLTAVDPIPVRIREELPRIAYAGSLNRRKNAFLWEWGNVVSGYNVDIYGYGFRLDEVAHPEVFTDHGFVDAEKLIAGMTSDYGLVWDGDNIDSCEGAFGSYLALNTPHKVSLYLRARLPLIIWSGAALAPTVKELGIGIMVDRLSDIPDALKAVTPEQYAQMKVNVEHQNGLIASGHYLRQAVGKAIKQLAE